MRKNFIVYFLIICVVVTSFLGGCSNKQKSKENAECSFKAIILEINESAVLVQPLDSENEINSSDKISFNIKNLNKIDAPVGSVVNIFYNGEIMESYPAQIKAEKWELCDRAGNYYFIGTIVEINGDNVLIEPINDNSGSIDKLAFNTASLPKLDIEVGSKIMVTYNGQVMYSYPAQISPISWNICK